jgi:tetraacyldisaccharide 4'-kinase
MKILKPKFWHKKNSFLSFLLLPVSILLQFIIIIKKTLKRKKKFSIPVICVGNIYIGGTGKTPLCIELTEILRKYNKKTAIIKKFYKNQEDEFRLIESKKVKLFKNISRVEAIKKAEIEKFDCVVLDDGFQDPSIIKNLNIICFNEKQLIGNGMTLPSGPLREPFSSIKNSQIILINGNFNKVFEEKIRAVSSSISIYYSEYFPTNLAKFANQDLLAFAGIGNPSNFFKLLDENNLKIVKKVSFPDHYNYSLEELENLVKYSKDNKLKMITTTKDYFRIKHYNIPEIEYLDTNLKIKNKDKFEEEIKNVFSKNY